jgi:phosphate starvation-inducible PhoH-like protein
MARKTKSKKNASYSLNNNSSPSKLLVTVTAKNAGQKQALKAISDNKITFIHGVAGSGKTHLAVGWGVQEMLKGHFQRMIFTRPYVEAGEKLGFLPGGSDSKFAPFVMPLFEVVSDYLGQEEIKALIEEKRIIIYPLAYMRGSTFKNSYVVADECQNMSIQQMRMMLTRLGENSKIVCTGDIEQSDLCLKTNGLADAINRLKGLPDLEFVEMGYESCVREKIVADIDLRYKNWQMGINSK